MTTQQTDVYAELAAQDEELDRLVAGLDADGWATPTPAEGWTVKDQIAHLTFVSRLAGLSAGDPETFQRIADGARTGFQAAVESALAEYAAVPTEKLLELWRTERVGAVRALAAVPAGATVPWLVNPLPPSVLASAGMMESFAHGLDVADALGVRREYTDRVAYLVAFGVHTRDFGYQAHGLPAPEEPFRFELTLPSGRVLEFGPDDAAQRVTGPAVDFCLLVSRRRHADDLLLTAEGEHARQWLGIAQAYRGPGGPGRAPGQFPAE